MTLDLAMKSKDSKNQSKKRRDKPDFTKIKNFYASKHITKKVKKKKKSKYIFVNDIFDKALVSRIYKELLQHNNRKTLNRYFSKDDIQMANQHLKRCSTSLAISEL